MSSQTEQGFAANGIRKIVWNSPYTETNEGRTVRGAVGLTNDGRYKAAEVSLYQEHGPGGRASFSAEDWKWMKQLHAHKEQAIYAARECVARTVNHDRQSQEHDSKCTSPAVKYGGSNESLQRELPPPKQSR